MNKLKFLLVGDGEEKRNIEDSIKKQCLMDKFLLTGSRKDVDMLYNAMDVFCLPSFSKVYRSHLWKHKLLVFHVLFLIQLRKKV